MDESPFQFILCNRCRKSYFSESKESLWLSSCSHIICSTCFGFDSGSHLQSGNQTCPLENCGQIGSILKLNEDETEIGIRHYFRPISNLLEELGMATSFQMGNLKDQVLFLTTKVFKQRQVLDKIQIELKKAKEITTQANRVPELEQEIMNLQNQLSAEKKGRQADRIFFDQDQLHQQTKKRLAPSPLPQPEPIRRAPSISSNSNRQHLNSHATIQPNRLTFSPSATRDHERRVYQNNLERSQSARPHNNTNDYPRFAVGSNPVGRGEVSSTGFGTRERLSSYAFDPNRSKEKELNQHSRPYTSPSAYNPINSTTATTNRQSFQTKSAPNSVEREEEFYNEPNNNQFSYQNQQSEFQTAASLQQQYQNPSPISFPLAGASSRTPFHPSNQPQQQQHQQQHQQQRSQSVQSNRFQPTNQSNGGFSSNSSRRNSTFENVNGIHREGTPRFDPNFGYNGGGQRFG